MPDYIFRANIDHYLELLYDDNLATGKRAVIVKLLVEEEDKLAHYQEQLEFAESRAANGRARLNGVRQKLDGIDPAAAHRLAAERLVANFEATQKLLDEFCLHLRARVMNSRL
jgi:hypothetical protein